MLQLVTAISFALISVVLSLLIDQQYTASVIFRAFMNGLVGGSGVGYIITWWLARRRAAAGKSGTRAASKR